MLIYLIFVGVILFSNYLFRTKRITKKQLCLVIGIGFVLVTGLRSVNVGSDTVVYYLSFMNFKNVSWEQLISQDMRDIAFYVLSWAVSKLTGSFVILTLITAVLFYYPVMKLIYKYSEDCALSALILMAFNYFQFSMTGMRQTIAFGLVILFFLEIHEKEPRRLKALAWIALAVLFHRSALIAILYLPIKLFSKTRKAAIACIVIAPFFFVFRNRIVNSAAWLFEAIGFGEYENSGTGAGLTTFLVYLLLTLGGILISINDEADGLKSNELIAFAAAGTALQSFVLANSVFFRLAWYFSIFFIIYIPRFLRRAIFKKIDLKLFEIIMYGAILFMYFFITIGSATVLPYEFFWQG